MVLNTLKKQAEYAFNIHKVGLGYDSEKTYGYVLKVNACSAKDHRREIRLTYTLVVHFSFVPAGSCAKTIKVTRYI